jgi:hypothetical protein
MSHQLIKAVLFPKENNIPGNGGPMQTPLAERLELAHHQAQAAIKFNREDLGPATQSAEVRTIRKANEVRYGPPRLDGSNFAAAQHIR